MKKDELEGLVKKQDQIIAEQEKTIESTSLAHMQLIEKNGELKMMIRSLLNQNENLNRMVQHFMGEPK